MQASESQVYLSFYSERSQGSSPRSGVKVALATSTTPAAIGRAQHGKVVPRGLRLDGVVKVQSGKLIEIFRFAQNDRTAVCAL